MFGDRSFVFAIVATLALVMSWGAFAQQAAPTNPADGASPAKSDRSPLVLALSSCKPECTRLGERPALTLEYELCGAEEELRAAYRDLRVTELDPAVPLSEFGRCLRSAIAKEPTSRFTNMVVMQKSAKEPAQAMSGNYQLMRACLSPIGWGDKAPRAHRDLTVETLKSVMGFHQSAGNPTLLVALASEQADTFEWLNPAAHAQTPDAGGTSTTAIAAFEHHLGEVLRRFRGACCAKRQADAAYQMGYLFHAIQDLSTHAGMTNAYHAYLLGFSNNDPKRKNPDLEKVLLDRAVTWSSNVLSAVDSSSYSRCAHEAVAVNGVGNDWAGMAQRGEYGERDGTPLEMLKFLQGAAAKEPADRRWFAQRDAKLADAWFEGHVMKTVAASLQAQCSP